MLVDSQSFLEKSLIALDAFKCTLEPFSAASHRRNHLVDQMLSCNQHRYRLPRNSLKSSWSQTQSKQQQIDCNETNRFSNCKNYRQNGIKEIQYDDDPTSNNVSCFPQRLDGRMRSTHGRQFLHRHSEPTLSSESDIIRQRKHSIEADLSAKTRSDWLVATDPKTGRPYYYHRITRETTWKRPIENCQQGRHDVWEVSAVMKKNVNSRIDTNLSSIKTRNNLASNMREASSSSKNSSIYRHKSAAHKDPISPQEQGYITNSRKSLRLVPDPVGSNARDRTNSTGSIFLRMGTMKVPDQNVMIDCVATILRSHLAHSSRSPIPHSAPFLVFNRPADLIRPKSITDSKMTDFFPTKIEITEFIKHIFMVGQMEVDCIIISLIYTEKLLKVTSGRLQLHTGNWRYILFTSMLLASKVWDDMSICNADFCKVWPEMNLKKINRLESAFLVNVKYQVRVSAAMYATYYFHLRSTCGHLDLQSTNPLSLERAHELQILSSEYQQRFNTKSLPRRRTRTLSNFACANGNNVIDRLEDKRPSKVNVSLEHLMELQVRGAGGNIFGIQASTT